MPDNRFKGWVELTLYFDENEICLGELADVISSNKRVFIRRTFLVEGKQALIGKSYDRLKHILCVVPTLTEVNNSMNYPNIS